MTQFSTSSQRPWVKQVLKRARLMGISSLFVGIVSVDGQMAALCPDACSLTYSAQPHLPALVGRTSWHLQDNL